MNRIKSFEEKVLSTVRAHSMISKGDKILVGLSGGKDSVVLLTVLNKLKSILSFDLYAFHLNHMIRGYEADRDESFSKSLCERLGIVFFSERADVIALAKKSGKGLEATARDVRYSLFEKYSKRLGGAKIATAHTLSDNAETVLLSLFRKGTLNEIPPYRDNVIRPLISVTTLEVVEYASFCGLEFVTDATNLENDYQRNFIRNVILPKLSEKYTGLEETLARSGEIFSSYKRLASSVADEYFKNESDPYSISSLKKLAVRGEYSSVLYAVLTRLFEGEGLSLTGEAFSSLSQLLRCAQRGASITVAGGKRVVVGYERLLILPPDSEKGEFTIPLNYGRNPIPDSPYTVIVELPCEYEARILKEKRKINKITKNILLDRNIMNNSLFIRSRTDGDKLRCRKITRSVKKFLIDEKIDRHLRDFFPIVCDSVGIVWVPGLGVADRAVSEISEALSFSLEINI